MRVSYYRLSAYFLPFRMPDGKYRDETHFEAVYSLYEFDRKLRNILFPAIEETEVFLRNRFSYYHTHKYGSAGYMNSQNFNKRHKHDIFIKKLETEISNNDKLLFVKHHNEKYGGQFPLWVAMELFTFGMLSYFYADLPLCDQKALAFELFHTIPKNIISWLRCCTDLRNICAHYGRLYFRVFSAIPANLVNVDKAAQRRLFGVLMALKELYPDSNKWNSEIMVRIAALFEEYADVLDLRHIGFPLAWDLQLRK